MKTIKPPFVRNPYNYDPNEASDESALLCKDKSLTQQQFVEESDINYIAEQFMRTGELKQVLDLPTQGDFEGIFDFQTAMNLIKEAKDQFMLLPAKIRSRFDNDPAKLLEFVHDDANRKEAEAIGLITPKEPDDGRASEETVGTTRKEPKGDDRAPGRKSGDAQAQGPGQEATGQDRRGDKAKG